MSLDSRDGAAVEDADRAFLIRYLAVCDAACPKCGYNLRALTSPRCPECGETLRISVGLVHPRLRGWLWLAVPLIASAGIGLFFLVLVLGRGRLPSSFFYPYLLVGLTCFWAAIPMAILVIVKRRSILRMRGASRACLTGCAWAASAIAMVLVFLHR